MNEKSYVRVQSRSDVNDMIAHFKNRDVVALDTETTSLNPRKGEIIGISISAEEGKGYYLPTKIFVEFKLIDNHIEGVLAKDIAKVILEMLVGKKLVFHNASFDIRFVKNYFKVDLLDSLHADTMLLMHTLNEEGAGFGSNSPFALKEIAKSLQAELGLDVEKAANEEQLELKASIHANGGSASKENYEIWKADIDILAKYAAADTDLTLRIFNLLDPKLDGEDLRNFFYVDEVMPLYREVTIPMEDKGVRLDMPTLTKAKEDIVVDLDKAKQAVFKSLMANEAIKLWIVIKAVEKYPPSSKGSYAQRLAQELNLNLPISKTGKASINAKTVATIEDQDIKEFFMTGDETKIPEDLRMKISLDMWKEDNDGNYFNIQSKDQLGEITFGVLGIKPLSHTKTGKPQFDDDLIDSIYEKHPWAKDLRVYNRLMKIKSTYIDRFLDAQEDGKYYFSYKQHGTISGRYGSDAQQLPRPKEEGDDDPTVIYYNNMVRAFFIPDSEHNIFIDTDYESLEPKTFAHVSNDEGLMDIFRNGWDFYSTIAIKTEGLNQYSPDKKAPNFLKKVAPAMRNKAKAYSLGVPYGMGGYALGKTLGVSTKEGEKLVRDYLDSFPNLKEWMERSKQFAKENGFIKTQVGRVRHLSKVKNLYDLFGNDLLDWNFKRRLESQYGKDKVKNIARDFVNGVNNSMNVQIQGLAASIVNRAAIRINRRLKEAGIRGWVCAQIHDQIICEVDHDKAKESAAIVQDCMENTVTLKIPLVAEPALAPNWRDGH